MRRWTVTAALVAALLPLQSVAQEAIVLAIEGWQQQSATDGVVTYRCASKICAAGSVVSYKEQPHRAGITLADFEAHHRRLAAQNNGVGRIRNVRLADIHEQNVEGVRILRVDREVDWDDGTTTFTVDARLIGPSRSFSLVSDSPQSDWTANNFSGFLRSLVIVAGISAP